ncbi:cell division protein FtsQ/DivIB [Chelatococcus composti]|uniref:cell division protein FtsQ/DivIB n=1 Tax=Chelatococcus composti TaxID=1743235 RepID=UPI00402B97CC
MDGGGRLLRPVGTRSPRGAVSAAVTMPAGMLFAAPEWPRLRLFRALRRRGYVRVGARRRLPRGLGSALTLALFASVGLYGAFAGGHVDRFRAENGTLSDAVARAFGFGIKQVVISGLAELRPAEILEAAGISPNRSVLFIDPAEVRRNLEAVPMIREASVRKLYPNELAITITEREPFALWQRNGEVFVVAADGTVIDFLNDARYARLPLVVGDRANERSADYLELLDAAGSLRERVKAGSLIAGRRWNLILDNGLEVRLPESNPTAAVARLAELEESERILERDILVIDMRQSDRVVMRLGAEAAAARAEAAKKKPVASAKEADI